jgi:DNA-binding XRE family transcriptional regulator
MVIVLVSLCVSDRITIIMRGQAVSIEFISVRQVKAARALLAWSQHDLAKEAGVSYPTIARLETRDGPLGGRPKAAKAIRAALEAAGVEFIAENGGGPGVRLK